MSGVLKIAAIAISAVAVVGIGAAFMAGAGLAGGGLGAAAGSFVADAATFTGLSTGVMSGILTAAAAIDLSLVSSALMAPAGSWGGLPTSLRTLCQDIFGPDGSRRRLSP